MLRILSTGFLGNAWDELKSKPDSIYKTFQQVGLANDMGGRENHLLRVQEIPNFILPAYDKNLKPMKPLTKEEIKAKAAANMKEIAKLALERRKRKRLDAQTKNNKKKKRRKQK